MANCRWAAISASRLESSAGARTCARRRRANWRLIIPQGETKWFGKSLMSEELFFEWRESGQRQPQSLLRKRETAIAPGLSNQTDQALSPGANSPQQGPFSGQKRM